MIEPNLLFVYGVLKRGFALDMEEMGTGEFISKATIPNATLYRIGYGVGLRLNDPLGVGYKSGEPVRGELFKITEDRVWKWLDMIENNGVTYTRKVVPVEVKLSNELITIESAWVYEHTFPGMIYNNLIEDGNFKG